MPAREAPPPANRPENPARPPREPLRADQASSVATSARVAKAAIAMLNFLTFPWTALLLPKIPIYAGHDAQPFTRHRGEQMFVRRVLRAGGVAMRDPDGRQAERVGEDFVRQRAAEVRQDRGLGSRGALDRGGRPFHPRRLG